MQEHQARAFADVADARPLGVGAVDAVGGIARLGQAIGRPLAGIRRYADERGAEVPAQGPGGLRIAFGAGQSPGAADVEVLTAGEHAPLFPVPLAEVAHVLAQVFPLRLAFLARRGQRQVRGLEVLPGKFLGFEFRGVAGVVHFPERRGGRVFAVGRDVEASVSGPGAFVMPSWQRLLEQLLHFQRSDVDLIDGAFLREVDDLMFRIGQVSGQGGQASGELVARNDADLTGFVDRIGCDEELAGFAMDHPAGARTADAFRSDFEGHVRVDGEELVVALAEIVGRVGRAPKLTRPRHCRAESAFHGWPLALGV